MSRPRLISLEGPALRLAKGSSRAGIAQRPDFIDGMLPSSVRYLDGLREWRGKLKPLCTAEQDILDACQWLELLTGKPCNEAAVVAALANIPHTKNASDWMTVLKKRELVEIEGLTIQLSSSGRARAKAPTSTPTIEALHGIVIGNEWGPTQRALKALIGHYPGTFSRAEIAAAADIQPESFSHDSAVKGLTSRRLAKYTADYRLIASAELFPARAMS